MIIITTTTMMLLISIIMITAMIEIIRLTLMVIKIIR